MESSLEELITRAASMDRETCLQELRRTERPRLDFSNEYLGGLSLEQLRHLVVAARLQATRGQSA